MSQNAASTIGTLHHRMRVRMPGKYIVVSVIFCIVTIVVTMSVLQSAQRHQAAMANVEFRSNNAGVESAYIALPPILVDLDSSVDGTPAFLRLKASVSIGHSDIAQMAERIEARKPEIMERLTFFLRERRREDFRDAQSLSILEAEMIRRINIVLNSDRIDDLAIEELVIQ